MSMNKIIQGDSKEILRTFGDNSFDGMLTDPPAGISFMGEKWDTFPKGGRGNSCRRTGSGNDCSSPGFACDVHWDKSLKARNQFISWLTDLMTEAKRILKPGGHALVWALPRTSHWTAFALEEAGFEIRDCVYHIFGQGFSKSLNIGKAIDKLQRNERKVVGKYQLPDVADGIRKKEWDCKAKSQNSTFGVSGQIEITKGNSEWEGWGTGLKPAVECWWLVRKPLSEKTVAENILKWGTGGIDVDGGRIGCDLEKEDLARGRKSDNDTTYFTKKNADIHLYPNNKGRFPANVILDEEAGEMLNEQSGVLKSGWRDTDKHKGGNGVTNNFGASGITGQHFNDTGGASRFFYCAKASRSERWFYCQICQDAFPTKEGEDHKHGKPDSEQKHIVSHPTQKSEKLCEYLIQLITREGQIVLDPFMGTGTTCVACVNTNRNYVGIELGIEYYEIARKRIGYIERKKQGELIIWK